MPEKQEKLDTPANDELKEKALDYLRRYAADGEELRQNRELALQAYRRDPYKEDAKIPDGSRSKFVMSDVADTIEWILPSLMRIFTSGKEVVKIEGQGPEDEKKTIPGIGPDGLPAMIEINPAGLLNEKVNWDFTRQNNGFLISYDWFKASMLNKFSVVKYWWEEKDEYKTVKFETPLSEQAYQLLQGDPKFTETKHEVGISLEGLPVHTVEGKILKKRIRRPRAEVVPPDEFICSLKTRDLKEDEFVAHRKRVHKFDLMRDYKLKENDLDQEGQVFTGGDTEIYERFKDLGGIGFFMDEDDNDFYYIYECYLKEDGEDERQPIILTILGNRVIRKDENKYGHPPFCMNSPIRMPHRAIGMSVYDLVGDIQKLRSVLVRYIATNIYYQTDSMVIIDPWKINIADFATQRHPGGQIRTLKEGVDLREAVMPLQPLPLAGHVFGFLETMDSLKEKRTGVTSYNQGLDADSLNKTARGISEIMAASQQRVELIARIYAETGYRDLMTAFAEMNIEFMDEETNIRLDQKWGSVRREDIDVLFDCTVDVALGTGSREMKVQQMGAMLDRAINPIFMHTGIVQSSNLYQMWNTMLVEMGYKNVDKYLTNPATLAPPPPPGGVNGQPVNGALAGDAGVLGPAGAAVPQGSPMVQ